MRSEHKIFFSLLGRNTEQVKSICRKEKEINWEEIVNLSIKHGVPCYTYEEMKKLGTEIAIDEKILNKWRDVSIVCLFRQQNNVKSVKRILNAAKEERLTLVLFKGCILADLYPRHDMRGSADTDMFVYEEDREQAFALMKKLGYVMDEEKSKKQVSVFRAGKREHVVEMHFRLWEDYHGRNIDILHSMQLTNKESLIKLQICGMEVTTLGIEQHLIFQIFHIVKHFFMESVGIRYLLDVSLYINRYIDKIDVAYFWEQMERMGYTGFCEQFFLLGIRWMNLDHRIMEGHKVSEMKYQENFLMDFINMGTSGDELHGTFQIMGIMTPYFVGEQTMPESKKGTKLRILFPKAEAMRDEFAYVKKYKFLLPIAWIHRFIDYDIYRLTHKKESYGIQQKMDVADYRLNLMKSVNLIQEHSEKSEK